jgi:ketosteroid isomerase-like protein
MSIFQKTSDALEKRDAQTLIDLYDDNFEFVRHQTGTSMSKSDMAAMIPDMMKNDVFDQATHRLIYENDEIMVEHYVMNFPDGTKEAVMGVNTIRNGKIVRLETGATPLNA